MARKGPEIARDAVGVQWRSIARNKKRRPRSRLFRQSL